MSCNKSTETKRTPSGAITTRSGRKQHITTSRADKGTISCIVNVPDNSRITENDITRITEDGQIRIIQ